MIIGDKKKAVGMILGRMHKDGSQSLSSEVPMDGDYKSQSKKAVAQDLLKAIESKSVDGIAAALQSLCDLIQSEDVEQDKEMMG